MREEEPSMDQESAPADPASGGDDTLGGYLAHHGRPPAFQGSDGHPYTVSPEVEKTPDLLNPYVGFLVFPRWAQTGVGIMGHLETPTVLASTTRQGVEEALGAMSLQEVQGLLEEAILRRNRPE